MIVILDTNVWLKELALNTGAGSALRFYLKQRGARLALPEIVRLEVQHNLRALITEAVDNISKSNRQLLSLFHSMKEIVLPTQHEIEGLLSRVFTGLGLETFDVPFTLESARESFLKTVNKLPPSDKTQEFKDGVLWADCLRLLEHDDVILATQDKAFCANREYGKGLAESLAAEARLKSHAISLVHSATDVLSQIRTDVPIDRAWFTSVVRQRAHARADDLLARAGAETVGEPSVRWNLFATENPEELYFTYTIDAPCADLTGDGRTNVHLALGGTGILQPSANEITEVHAGEEALVFVGADGSDQVLRNVYAAGHAVIGHRTVEHSVRYPIGSAG